MQFNENKLNFKQTRIDHIKIKAISVVHCKNNIKLKYHYNTTIVKPGETIQTRTQTEHKINGITRLFRLGGFDH